MAVPGTIRWADGEGGGTPVSAARLNEQQDWIDARATEAQAAAAAAEAPTDAMVSTLATPGSGSQLEATLNGTYVRAVVVTGDGIDPTGVADSTAAMQAKFATAGATHFVIPAGTYQVAIPQGGSLASFAGRKGVVIDAADATINNTTSYTADELTPIFLVDGCDGFRLTLGEYVGFELPTPGSHLGYRGATLVRAINGARNVVVDAKVTNARYAVQTGEYGDPTKGGCVGFDLRIRGSMVGYPLAAYLADGIRHDIDVDGVHRAVYIAGCHDVRGVARWRDQYIADTAYLITDALASGTDAAAQADPVGAATTSRGCSNVDVVSIDKGSTVFAASSSCAGITLSRVDPCTFSNIRVGVYTVGTDTVSTKVGGWRIVSGAKAVQTRYPFNWEPHVVLENIEVRGVVDHSAATLAGNSGSEFYVLTYESTTGHAATMRNFQARDFTFRPSSGNTRGSYFFCPGLATPATFEDFNTPGVWVELFTSATIPTVFSRATIDEIKDAGVSGGNAVVIGDGTVVTKAASATSSRMAVRGGRVGGAGATIKQREFTLTLTGASVSAANAVLAGEMVLGVQGYVKTAITGATGYQVGVSGDVSRYVNTNTVAAGSAFGPANAAATELTPRIYQASTALVVTAKTSNFTAGVLRLVVTFIEFPAPTA